MTTCSIRAAMMAAAVALAGLLSRDVTAQGTAVRALVSNGLKGAMEQLGPLCESKTGRRLSLQYSSTAALKKRIESGEAFDVSMITTEAIDDLIKQGRMAGGSRAELGRSVLGIGIRTGAPKPDIRTTDGLKRTLRDASSITYPRDGASRGYVEQMFERLGIASEVKPKIILAAGSGPAVESVAAGRAALVITLFSEILPVRGVEILGPLPGEFHYEIRFAAAASAGQDHADAATALIACVTDAKAVQIFKASGVERERP
jgi:molybdate transport system substrate-binding protein